MVFFAGLFDGRAVEARVRGRLALFGDLLGRLLFCLANCRSKTLNGTAEVRAKCAQALGAENGQHDEKDDQQLNRADIGKHPKNSWGD
jgi:hypothetical protein